MTIIAERRRSVREPSTHPKWWHALYVAWTKAAHGPGYDKRDWKRLAEEIEKIAK